MTTLRLSLTGTDGTPAEVPYTLPTSVRFDCYVPGLGLCHAFVDVSADEIDVTEIVATGGQSITVGSSYYSHPAVLEQTGDVCETIERPLRAQAIVASCSREPHPLRLTETERADSALLRTIADVANAESDLHSSWGKFGDMVKRDDAPCDPSDKHESFAHAALDRFISEVLVERAQELATKAAKARQTAWEAEQAQHLREERLGQGVP